MLVVAVVAAAGFLSAGWRPFPMDDAYIHFVYARNLAEHGLLSFNLNPPDGGLGTTSVLWPLLLAGLDQVCGIANAAHLLGLLAYLAFALGAFRVAELLCAGDRRRARWCAAIVSLSGNLLWFSFSGMETMLWLALGVWALLAWHDRRFALGGVLLGFLMLARIEGGVLACCLGAVEVLRQRKLTRGVVLAAVISAALLSPWLLYVHARTGHYLPTSYAGKRHAQLRGAVQVVKNTVEADAPLTDLESAKLPWWVNLLYPLGVVAYNACFVAGGAYLPGPKLPLPGQLGDVIGGLSYLGLLALLGLFVPLWMLALRRVRSVARQPLDERRAVLLALLAWILLHNLAYWLKLPTPGTASRYQVVNHVAVWLLATAGAWQLRDARRQQVAIGLLAGLVVLNAVYWRGVYASDIRHMVQVRLASADYIRTHLPPDAVVAAHDIGALGWRMERRCLDLGGLIDPTFLEYARDGRVAEFLQERGAGYLVLPTKHSSQAAGFYDYAAFVGLQDNPLVHRTVIEHFENDYADWARGAAPTWNALPGVTLYRLTYEPTP